MNTGEPKLGYLRRLNLLVALSPAEVDSLASVFHGRAFRRGEIIFGPGGPSDRIYLVKSGAVRVYWLSPDGREFTAAILQPGHVLGMSALAGVAVPSAFAEALDDVYLYQATTTEFLSRISQDPQLAVGVIVMLARQFLQLGRHLEQLASQDVPTRLAQTLLQLAEQHGGQIPLNLSQEDLASLAGTTRATVSKTLAQFAEQGLVTVGYRRLAITDVEALRREAKLDAG